MPTCQNCGSTVSKAYVRVLTPREFDEPEGCPNCPDLTRGDDGRMREIRWKA